MHTTAIGSVSSIAALILCGGLPGEVLSNYLAGSFDRVCINSLGITPFQERAIVKVTFKWNFVLVIFAAKSITQL